MSVHLNAFASQFSYLLANEIVENRKVRASEAFLLNVVKAITTYTPIVNTIVYLGGIIKQARIDSKNPLRHDEDLYIEQSRADRRAKFIHNVICATGLGILLLPVHLIATITKASLLRDQKLSHRN